MGITERKERQRAELREHILRVARDMVMKEGFGALSMRKLADAVEYAPATLYLHFENRDAIARELCVRGFQELLALLEPAAAVKEPVERLSRLAQAYLSFGLEHPETYRLIFMEDPKLSAELFQDKQHGEGPRSFALLVRACEDLKAAGRAPEATPAEQLAEVFWAGLHGIISLKLTCTGFQGSPAEVLAQTLVATLVQGSKPGKRTR
ncbi:MULTISPECIES: TetR/AcrR family transcriptional regulator [unclassified Corallococcus]|uniref:TetR/AcrR family transcriptional regulator n=1 Tax=unclassified Corallococcus TaxID=2685029 RepID=UPI001A905B2E|nr:MULTISPECIES: TetR/AcrR family transcriptional regulator [unclassified Corallococcus]MBN9686460.1 TetR/AcrR family transcriptional regulator [Corallococcus sp. NCSPR001]WAS82112.1 TetR/AcrR family transcriptional regulator [Corallococcus sp. NCRR]